MEFLVDDRGQDTEEPLPVEGRGEKVHGLNESKRICADRKGRGRFIRTRGDFGHAVHRKLPAKG